MLISYNKTNGFTIVELLVVIVIIAILATVTILAYNGVQNRGRQSKISADIETLNRAIVIARQSAGGVALRYVTLSTASGASCWGKASGTDLAALAKTDACWTSYYAALQRISDASGVNVRNLEDPWGRPYYIDENEGEGVPPETACNDDNIGYYAVPFTTGQTMIKSKAISNIQPACF